MDNEIISLPVLIDSSRELKNGQKECKLCLKESLAILTNKKNNGLNKRNEILNTCRHKRNFFLKQWVTKEKSEARKILKIERAKNAKREKGKT